MRLFVMAPLLGAAAVLCGAADRDGSAKDAPGLEALGPAFKNTIVSTYPDGRQGELWLSPDGTYRAEGRRHDLSDGKWTLKDDKICLKQSHPPTLPFSFCTAVPSGGIGKSWSAKAVTGETVQVRIVKGRRG